MAVETFTEIPDSFFAGDTVRATLSNGKFPSSAWTLAVVFRGTDGAATSFTATAGTGGTFNLLISATQSAALAAGLYNVTKVYTEVATSERETDEESRLATVFANPTANVAKSIARQTLEAMEAAQLALAGSANLTVNFNGQSFTKRNPKDMADAIERQRAIVLREEPSGRPTRMRRVLARL